MTGPQACAPEKERIPFENPAVEPVTTPVIEPAVQPATKPAEVPSKNIARASALVGSVAPVAPAPRAERTL